MKVSVIVTMYNASAYIERCAVSLFEQTYHDIEYIFVDDCSTDDTVSCLNEVIERYPQHKSRIYILLNEKNMKVAATRTRGMQAATGDFMIQVDADDYVDASFVEKLINKAVASKSDIVICDMYYDFGKVLKAHSMVQALSTEECMIQVLTGELHGSLCNKLIKAALIKENGLYCPSDLYMGEDKYVVLGALSHAASVCYVTEPLYYYNKTNGASMASQSKFKAIPSFIKLTSYINSLFGSKKTSQALKEGIEYHKAKVLGHILLYGGPLTPDQKLILSGITKSSILKHPHMPLHYKVAGLSYLLKLNCVITFLRFLMGKLRK